MDDTTILFTVICLIAGTASIAWFALALPLKIAPKASLHFAFANALFMISIVLTLQRTSSPSLLYWPIADLLGLCAAFELRIGSRQLFKLSPQNAFHAVALLCVGTVMLMQSPEPSSALRFGILYSLGAVDLLR